MSQVRVVFVSLVAFLIGGCGPQQLPVAPVKGQIFYQGKPMEFGSVMFQPTAGPPARGVIQPDGTFELSTYGVNDGVVVGTHKIRIACVESQRGLNGGPRTKPGDVASEDKPLIPLKYSHLDSSGLIAEVTSSNEPFVWHLTD